MYIYSLNYVLERGRISYSSSYEIVENPLSKQDWSTKNERVFSE